MSIQLSICNKRPFVADVRSWSTFFNVRFSISQTFTKMTFNDRKPLPLVFEEPFIDIKKLY